jgi:hypothetical protein
MKKLIILSCTMIALSSFIATTVRAQSPHFIKGPTASLDTTTGEYCVSFKEAGLGSGPVTYTLTAGAGTTFWYRCFTKSNNTPQGSPNGVSGSGDSTHTTITPHNGQVSATICLIPSSAGASCTGAGLVLRFYGADYDNVTFSDGLGNDIHISNTCSGYGCTAEDE